MDTIITSIIIFLLVHGVNYIWTSYPLFSFLRDYFESLDDNTFWFKYVYWPALACTYCMCMAWGFVISGFDLTTALCSIGLKVVAETYGSNK